MQRIPIDPTRGAHAAAAVPDELLHSLLQTLLFEIAVRTDRRVFEGLLGSALASRAEMERALQRVRHQRDLMQFAAEVRRDLAALPVLPGASGVADQVLP